MKPITAAFIDFSQFVLWFNDVPLAPPKQSLMLKLQKQHVSLFISMLAFTSCYTYDPFIVSQERQQKNFYHASISASTPLLQQKNDLHLQLAGGISRYTWGEYQAAFAPAKNLGFVATYAINDADPEVAFKALNLGIGYFTKASNHLHFETYGGFERGFIENYHKTGISRLRMNKWYVQPGIAFTNEQNTSQFIFVSRFSSNKIAIRETSYAPNREPYTSAQLQKVGLNPNFAMWEPGVFYRYGIKNITLVGGYRYSLSFSNANFDRVKGVGTLGFVVRLNTGKKVIADKDE